jgi:hypothetical protein
MKKLQIALVLLALPIVCTAASGQSSGTAPERPSPRVIEPHCQYTGNDPVWQYQTQSNPRPGQCRKPGPCPSPCCSYGYPPPSHPPFLFEPENGTHAAAGALIGLGLGAALGAAKDGHAGSRFAGALVVGGFGALIGAIVGHGIVARPRHRRHPDWDEPEERAVAPQPNPPAATSSGQRASPDPPLGPETWQDCGTSTSPRRGACILWNTGGYRW